MLLAIDTASNVPGIALLASQGILGELTWQTHEHHTKSLMPQVVRLLESLNADIRQVQAVAVATGPGSFTGLRIGLSAAKGLAFSLNATLLGVPTLDITASAFAFQPLPVCAVMLAGRGRYAAAVYDAAGEIPGRTSAYLFGSAEVAASQIAESARGQFVLTGETDESFCAQVRLAAGERVRVAPRALHLRRAGYLAELAWRRWQAGQHDEIPSLTPYYIPTAALA